MKIEIEKRGFEATRKLLFSLDRPLRKKLVENVTKAVFDDAHRRAKKHRRTGRMEDNVDFSTKGETGKVFVGDKGMLVPWRGRMVNYALFVHFKTRPHFIHPKNKKALRWVKPGTLFFSAAPTGFSPMKPTSSNALFAFAKSVRHPGYKGDPFLYDAARKVLNDLDKHLQESLDELR